LFDIPRCTMYCSRRQEVPDLGSTTPTLLWNRLAGANFAIEPNCVWKLLGCELK
jgi:hypothetical protein